jgi:uncharacterized protein YdhG (YjbR/CyaY superfamily)
MENQMKAATIDEYISLFPENIQEVLQKVRSTIVENAPNAIEKIHYGMPAFWQNEYILYFAEMKNHLGLYPTPNAIVAFSDKLQGYKTSKGAIQFPYNSVNYELIADITLFRVECVKK